MLCKMLGTWGKFHSKVIVVAALLLKFVEQKHKRLFVRVNIDVEASGWCFWWCCFIQAGGAAAANS